MSIYEDLVPISRMKSKRYARLAAQQVKLESLLVLLQRLIAA